MRVKISRMRDELGNTRLFCFWLLLFCFNPLQNLINRWSRQCKYVAAKFYFAELAFGSNQSHWCMFVETVKGVEFEILVLLLYGEVQD